MKKFISYFAAWFSDSGIKVITHPDQSYLDAAKLFVAHVEGATEPWEWKHRQALRALMNRFPKAKIRDLNLAIEIVVQQCSA